MTNDIPEEIINYCIDEKLTIAEGFASFIEDKFAVVDSALRDLKREVTSTLTSASIIPAPQKLEPITEQDRDDIESFLKFLDQQIQSNEEE